MRSNSQQNVSYCVNLHPQNPGLRKADLEPSPNRSGDKINMLKQGRNIPKESKSYRTAWTKIWIPDLKEVDLEPSAKRGTNRTKAIVSFYWSSQSLLLKMPPNQVSPKPTKVDPIRSSRT